MKKTLRNRVLAQLDAEPVICETHGGMGKLFGACYSHVDRGVVIEKRGCRADVLARQRPTWAVYEADCGPALLAGLGSHLPINFVDVDPWGDPWPALRGFFESERSRPDRVLVVVTDGLRMTIRLNGGGRAHSLESVILQFGPRLHARYLDACRELMIETVAVSGYEVKSFSGYHCGHGDQMTHYWAELVR